MNAATLTIGLILLVAAVASAYLHAGQRKQRQAIANTRRIAHAVKEYFARSSVEVSAQCLHTNGCFLILVESEPLKRFRYSHIVEASLISHVEKALGLHADRVFWRFPLPVGTTSPRDTVDIKPPALEDDYIIQGIREANNKPGYHVAEDSWDQFEKAQQGRDAMPPSLQIEDAKDDRGR
ncbi:MAG: hypothetical protein KGZ31_05935 [Sulfuritalea sp.]|nr:hypothetical protein [Sulfuritalea sp.]